MSGFGFYSLTAAWLFALSIPLIIVYFLKLRRPRVNVPSLLLWTRAMEDRRVNSPFQRFKRNMLLLLQILLLLLLVLAAMQPFLRAEDSQAHRRPVLIDCSASMAARDADGKTRLEVAREQIEELIDNLLPDQELCLIAFSSSPRKLTGFTNNQRILRDALKALEVADVEADLEEAMRMAQALSRTSAFSELLLISDGNVPSRADFELSFDIRFQRLPSAAANIGITALNAQRAGSAWQVFLRVEGSAETTRSATVEITIGEEEIARERVTVTAGSSEQLMVSVEPQAASRLTARLLVDGSDSLASDNIAHLHLPVPRALFVAVPEKLSFVRHALAVQAGTQVYDPSAISQPDVVISDQVTDLASSALTRVSLGVIPTELSTLVTIEEGQTEIVDWRRDAPLLRHVQLADVMMLKEPRLAPGAQEADFEQAGYTVIAYARNGPLILRRTRAITDYVCLFHPERSTLPYRVGFPVMIANILEIARQKSGIAQAQAQKTGVLPPMDVPAGLACSVVGPDDQRRERTGDAAGTVTGIPARQVGIYTSTIGAAPPVEIGASLLSAFETRLEAVEDIVFNENLAISANTEV
ncbi:MAG: Ca-activated chloride channel family protein, partial [Rhodothermales bacterium]